MNPWLALVLLSSVGLLGDGILKKAGATSPPSYRLFGLGTVIYAGTAFGWFYVLRHMKMTTLSVAYPIFQAVSLALMGVVVFGESLARREIVGYCLGFIALILIK